MEAEIPQEGDSVPNLSKCTARTLFDELRQRVENECKSASDLKFNDVSLNKFVVPRQHESWPRPDSNRAFELKDDQPDDPVIKVTKHVRENPIPLKNTEIFVARPKRLSNGDCVFEVERPDGGREDLTVVQVSQRALEGLSFSGD